MRKILKTCLTVMAVSAFVATPIVTVVGTDGAYAKNGNGGGKGGGNGGGQGNGGGNGGGKGGGNKGGNSDNAKGGSQKGGKSDVARSGGKSSKGSASKSRGGKGFKLRDIFSAQKKTSGKTRTVKRQVAKAPAKARTKRIVKASVAPVQAHTAPKARPERKVKGTLHPSNLGKLNGAINSSPNAKLAHIANGNFNGPVGLSAALALADYEYALEREAFDAAERTLELAEAFDLIENAPTEEELEAARELIDNGVDDGQADLDAQAALDYPDLTDAIALTDGVDEVPTEADIADAEALVEEGVPSRDGVTTAEEELLAAYKGTLGEAETEQVLDAIRGGLPTEEQIAAVLPEEDEDDPTISDDPAAVDDEVLLVIEEG
ncbi:hypothetical protein C8N43_0843 [Litoreibacter ponti]|uniref:YfdX protein n=1 Tax=Litoreibacter ponti TaxID=1510457 RepID=A0A2T6BJE9_9RHOB|nr:hypothetical protein [Litoreibacter ponti]PTX56191.1 hypothetical protein C8N43_0843 [Litoreibacter ponti]